MERPSSAVTYFMSECERRLSVPPHPPSPRGEAINWKGINYDRRGFGRLGRPIRGDRLEPRRSAIAPHSQEEGW
jgi:hypothetical protein